MLRDRGPIMQGAPIRGAHISVLYSDPVNGDRARALFESVLRQKLERFGLRAQASVAVLENEEHVSRAMQQLLRTKPAAVLVASTTAPAGPDDVVGRAMGKIGCEIERFWCRWNRVTSCSWDTKNASRCSPRPVVIGRSSPTSSICCYPCDGPLSCLAMELACLGHGGLLS